MITYQLLTGGPGCDDFEEWMFPTSEEKDQEEEKEQKQDD